MEFVVYGIDFKHTVGEFCHRTARSQYFISYFKTDFLYECEGEMLEGKKGDFMIVKAGDIVYHGPSDREKSFVNDWMYVRGGELVSLFETYPLPMGRAFSVETSVSLSRTIEKIHREKSFMLPGWKKKCDNALSDFLIDLYRAYESRGGLGTAEKMDFARGEIMRDYSRPWTLSQMAELVGYSESRFCALYKEKFGTSPMKDLIDKRMEEAMLLIKYGNLTLGEISSAVGFNSLYYFSKYFKKKMGVSPKEYRQSLL